MRGTAGPFAISIYSEIIDPVFNKIYLTKKHVIPCKVIGHFFERRK